MDSIEITIGDDQNYRIPKKIGKYQFIRKIGYGTFSCVIMVRNLKTKELFACKVVSRQMLVEQGIFLRFEQELRLMQSFEHPYIVRTYDVVYDTDFIYVIMEYCPNGELFGYILSLNYLPELEVNRILRETLHALQYLHNRGIAHRDIKPENILLDAKMHVKLCDFGLCKVMEKNKLLKTPCGSPFYAPPEVISNVKYDGIKSDIWSLGVVTYTMATGNLPWTETNQTQLFQQITSLDIEIPLRLSPPLQQVLQMMLKRDPKERPTPAQLLAMPWLQEEPSLALSKPTPLRKGLSMGNANFSVSNSLAHLGIKPRVRKSLIIRPDVEAPKPQTPINPLIRKIPKIPGKPPTTLSYVSK